jgi:hypothetical protein
MTATSGLAQSSDIYSYNFVQNRTQIIDALDRVETYLYQDNGLNVRQIHDDRSHIDQAWGTEGGDTAFLTTSIIDEVGAKETCRLPERLTKRGSP